MGEEKKKTAKEIIETYDGPPIPMKISGWVFVSFCRNRWN